MGKQLLNYGFRIFVSIVLLVVLFTRIDVDSFVSSLQSIDIALFGAAILFFCLFLITWTARWQLFMRESDIHVGFFHTLKTLLIGFAIALFLPSTLGTDVGRTFDMARTKEQKIAILSTVFMDRLIGLLAVVVMAIIAIGIAGYQYLDESILIPVILAAVAFGMGWIFFFNKGFMGYFRWTLRLPIVNRFEGSIRELYSTIYLMQRKRRLFITAFSISMLIQSFEILSVLMLAYAIGVEINPIFFFIFMPIIWIILIIPISIGGLGLREAVFAFFFTQVGMSTTDAVTVSLLYYMLYAITGVVGGASPLIHYIYSRLIQLFTNKQSLPNNIPNTSQN